MMEQISNFFISSAYADTPSVAAGPQGGGLSLVMMFVIFFVFVYFTIWRPQSKRAREQQNLLSSLAKGDEVMTAGGLLGRISKMTDQYITLAVANNVEILMQKTSIVNVLPKGTIKAVE
jgi:preprotein translocase subunit YajC